MLCIAWTGLTAYQLFVIVFTFQSLICSIVNSVVTVIGVELLMSL